MNTTDSTDMFELTISPKAPWESVDDVDIMSILAFLYDHKCPFSLMDHIMTEFVDNDKALVFCGSLEKCNEAINLCEKSNLVGMVSPV